MRYYLDTDNDGHWYIIPVKNRDDWNTWLEQDQDDEASWDVPDYAVAIGGSPSLVEFADYDIV